LGVPPENLVSIFEGGTDKWGDNKSEETRKNNRIVKIELAK
jgi:hypothetical protein